MPARRRPQPGPHGARARACCRSFDVDNLPTGGVVAIDFAGDAIGQDLADAPATLAYYDFPKNPELFVTEN